MSNSFRIADFLHVEGPELVVDLPNRRVTGFSLVRLTETGTALELDASADAASPRFGVPGPSTIEWDKNDATSIEGGIALKENKEARVSFHWPNPLTPRSAGLFFRVIVENDEDRYRLRFIPALDSNLPEDARAAGHGYFQRDASTWLHFFLAEQQGNLTLAEWRALWLNRIVGNVPAASLQAGALFAGEGALVDVSFRGNENWKFGWRFSTGTDGISCAIAAIDIEDGAFAVNTRALRLEERAELRPRPLFWNRDLTLRCASMRGPVPVVSWVVDWHGVPTFDAAADRKDHLSLRSFWQELARHWALGLRSLRSRNALTFVPTDLDAPEESDGLAPWTFRFRCGRTGSTWRSALATIGRLQPTRLRFELGSLLATTGTACMFQAEATPKSGELPFEAITQVTETGLSSLLRFDFAASEQTLGRFLVGGLVLDLQTVTDGKLRIDWVAVRTQLGQPPLGVRFELNASAGTPRPGTEDPERGFEIENDLLERERPLVIDLREPTNEKTRVEIVEVADATRSRVLEILVRNAENQATAGAADVVVIDPAPMLVARVHTTGATVNPGAILASYRDDGERPPGWELLTETGAMTLVLPPQAIGEEMIKGNLTVEYARPDETKKKFNVPFVDRPFDFRLSPPARLVLDRTDVDTARAAAPWALRRLLDRREAVVGLKLDATRFELLYGLTAKIEKIEGLRIAEQDAFVGRIPIAPAIRDRAQRRLTSSQVYSEKELVYASDAVKWIRGLFARPAQLPVFRDFAKRERLVLRDGVTFDFRPTRQTAHPLQIEKTSRNAAPQPVNDLGPRLPLRGGVDFPFESDNIYKAVVDHKQKASPGQPQGHVSGLVFGALGGSGSQQAAFDGGRSIIITETAQGRLSSLTLIRVGRIAMLWHHARHVIVYERTTRTAPRYEHEQPNAFEGLAALRKVKEYIEITQHRRGYPDFDASAQERPTAGPVTGCTYETVVIPVKSSWGYDIEDGWVMPLRGPLLEHEAPFYPEPKIFLELARAESKGAGAINHLVADPSQLAFFTTTREGLGADTDRWPAWPDVDFPLTRRPLPPKVRFLPGFSGANHQPDAAPHDYGQKRFTIDVVPPEEAANLLHGRPGNGLEARVRNVSLLRAGGAASVRSTIDDVAGVAFAEAEARIGDGLAELAQHLERIAERAADAAIGEVAGLRDEARNVLADARAEAARMLDAVRAADTLIANGAETWKTIRDRSAKNAAAAAAKLQEELKKRFAEDIAGVAERLVNPLPLDEARTSLRAASESVCRQMIQRMEAVPFLAVEVRERLDTALQNARAEVHAVLDGIESAWLAHIAELQARLPAESPGAIEQELFAAILDGRARIAAFGAGFSRFIKDRLGPLFGDVGGAPGAVGRLTAVVDAIVQGATSGIDETLDIIPPFDVVPPDWPRLIELLKKVFPNVDGGFEAIGTELLDAIEEPVDKWNELVRTTTDAMATLCNDQANALIAAAEGGAAALQAAAAGVVDTWNTKVKEALDSLSDEAKKRFDTFAALPAAISLQQTIERVAFLEKEVRDRIAELDGALNDATKSVREVAGLANDIAQKATAGMRRIGEQVEQAVAKELRDAVQGAQGAALELARTLAEGPVTDTLRCTRDWVGYYYDTTRDALDVTRAAAIFNDLGGSVLNSLAAQVPFDRIRDRVLAQLGNFDLNKLFPDFAGLKLEHLLSGMTIPTDPDGEYDWIRMRHGFDRARLTAWSEISIDKQFDDSPELFTLPPVTLSVMQPRFTASSRIEADASGARAQRTRALLVADWTVTLNGQMIMSIEKGGLYFDSDGGFRFDFASSDLQLAPALQFVTDALRSLRPPDEGLTLTPLLPGGISVELSLPLPDIGTGAFTLTGITLYTHFDLLVAGGFEVRTGMWLSRPERPFGMAVLFLGGGGWFGVDVRYKPPKEFETLVSVGLAAGAFVALNFGVARGSAGVLLTVGLDFYRNWLQSGSQDLAITIGILVWGEFSILGIVSAYLRVILRVEYRNGEMTGYGNVSVSIKICWCFTLRVNAPIRLPFKSSRRAQPQALTEANADAITPPTIAKALDVHFLNLDV